MTSHCVICSEELSSTEDVSKLTAKGLATLISSSLARNDGLEEKLENVKLPLSLHTTCRKDYTRPDVISAYKRRGDLLSASTSATSSVSKTLRSCVSQFDFKNDCLFCGEEASEDVKLAVNRRKSISRVETIEYREKVVNYSTERNDKWGDLVLSRVQSSIDLIAAEARYHHQCSKQFFLTKTQGRCKLPRGRPKSNAKSNAFLKLCSYLENNDECQYSMAELLELMDTYLSMDKKVILLNTCRPSYHNTMETK